MDELTRFRGAFSALIGDLPFPWQESLYTEWFSMGVFPASCNLPTGLGKTSVIAIWLIALAYHPEKIPRRLVYVVNRRTVVDQTTTASETKAIGQRFAGELRAGRDAFILRNQQAMLSFLELAA
jgi:CRISPR-associated helicase Cas3